MSATANSELYTELRERQRAIEGRIARYRAKIADSERELKECLEMLQQFPRNYPVLTLPPEIISEIFVYSSLPSPLGLETIPNPRYAPMLLLHVCRAWRAIAITTPRLWANLWLEFRRLPPRFFDAENFDKFLADYAVRLGAFPLSLKVTGCAQSEDDGRRVFTAIFDQLASHLEVLELITDMNHYREHNLLFPLLRKLFIGFYYNADEDLISLHGRPLQTFCASPQLRELCIFNSARPSHIAIPWERLTEFYGEELSSRECVEVLRSAPSLVKCTFESGTKGHANLQALTHPNLQSLKIGSGDEPAVRFITLPALQDLELSVENIADEHLLQFISRSSSTLLKFSAMDVPIQSLQGMANLTHLQLCSPEGNYLFTFLGMLDRTRNPSFLPPPPDARIRGLFTVCEPLPGEYIVVKGSLPGWRGQAAILSANLVNIRGNSSQV
ncbi:F-box domain-containing protein [Mycena sanguinolenta]|uniref:F-box domain-containing protein n=1 Tax=Mycena sanguinolenta TaxID=230812 RepID=A0A8H7DBD4_9AGAR|nr:F-box domain-containing protein [Mycena sanguinolenta]